MIARENDWTPGKAIDLRPGLLRVLAPNPSSMTLHGTNTYILGEASVAVIDPGPDSSAHLAAILAAIGGRRVSHIIVTHSHLDHAPLARPLARTCRAPIIAFGDSLAGRSDVMIGLADSGLTTGGEGVDSTFAPDIAVSDGDMIPGDSWQLKVIHTPGHFGNHICLQWDDALFSGDHVMQWASSLVSPPDGDLGDYMASCRKLTRRVGGPAYPGHGSVVTNLTERVDWLIAHRLQREAQIIAVLHLGPSAIGQLTAVIYTDITPALLPAAARNVFAHLIDLHVRNIVTAVPDLRADATFSMA